MKDVYLNYATAMFDIAMENDELKKSLGAFLDVSKLFKRYPELLTFLASYNIPKDVQKGLVDDLFSEGSPKYFTDFLKVMIDHHRIAHFQDVAKNYASLANTALGIGEGLCYSATPLSEIQLSNIEGALEKRLGQKVSLHNIVEASLLGGVKVALGGKVYDGTLNNRLEGLKEALQNNGGKQV